jgi:ubiquinone/menaquinone biosynthesis C-methylase UbiE
VSTDRIAADEETRETWRRAAEAWERRQAELREATAPVSAWIVDAVRPRPGQRLLELAAGPGETGFLAAAKLEPGGTLLSTDQSEEMVGVARRRAQELGLGNVEFAVVDAQQLELAPEQFDGVMCRFGYMLMGDPDAALARTRRVLKPGGRLAMAVWGAPQENLWMAAPAMQLIAAGAMEMPDPQAAGPFSMADRSKLESQLTGAGFRDVTIDHVAFAQQYESFEQYWEITLDLAAPIARALGDLDEAAIATIRDAVGAALAQFKTDGAGLSIPARAVVASARA